MFTALEEDRFDTACENRKRHRKTRALFGTLAFSLNRAAMKFYQVANDSQTQTKAAIVSSRRTIGLPKTIKNARQKLWTDSFTSVANCKPGVFTYPLQTHINTAVFVSELDRVGQQIPNYLLKAR